MSSSSRQVCVVTALVLASAAASGQTGRYIELDHADSLVGKILDGEEVRELIGNVRLRQDNIRLSCDRALQYLRTGRVLLNGNLVIQEDSLIIRAPRGVYHRETRRAEALDSVILDDGSMKLRAQYGEYFIEQKRAFFRSNVEVWDSTTTINADSLTYFREENRSVAKGRVRVFNWEDNIIITGGHLENHSDTRFNRMTQNPVLVQFERTPLGFYDTLVVRSRVMESYQDTLRRMVAIDSVQIVRNELAALAGHATFFGSGDSIYIRQSPVIWYENTQVTGDSVNVYLEERKLRLVRVLGNAFAVSQSDSLRPDRFDQLTGETMEMFFVNRELERIDVENRAISVYHLYEDTLANGLNKTSGDRIVLLFRQGKVHAIRIYGGIEGQYVPENLVAGKEQDYAIAGFRWHGNRPVIRKQDIRL
jgi:lipopolysaccharide export system protein LptA